MYDGNTVASLLQLVFKIEIQFMLIVHTLPREAIWAMMIYNINVGFLPFMLNHFIQTNVFENPNSTIIFCFDLADQINEKEKGKHAFFCERNLKNKQWFKLLQPFFCWSFQIGCFCSPSSSHLDQYAHAHRLNPSMFRTLSNVPKKNYSG